MSEIEETAGDQIRNRRKKELGMTQAQLAERAHVSVATIRHIENGTGGHRHRDGTLEPISKALGWPPDDLELLLYGTQQEVAPAQIPDGAALLSSVEEVRKGIKELREHQDRSDAVSRERHQSLVRRVDNIGAMLKQLNPDLMYDQVPDVDIEYDHGERSTS